MVERRMLQRELRAIKLEVKWGYELQREHPEIVDDYRGGMTITEIVVKYNLTRRGNYVEESVRRALSLGNDNENLGVVYEPLLSREESEEIAKEHKSDSAKKTNKKLTKRRRRMISRAGIKALGYPTWTKREESWLRARKNDPVYKSKSGVNMNGRKLTRDYNEKFGRDRSVRAVISELSRLVT